MFYKLVYHNFIYFEYNFISLTFFFFKNIFTDGRDRDTDLELGDEILVDGMVFRDKKNSKDQLEVAIGDGMEFTIHGSYISIFIIIIIIAGKTYY